MINVNAFIDTLPITLYGMLGIFVVIGVIMLLTKVLCKFCKD